tara:strand:+ start:1487 stop:1876 length:390 start_codon:yes stop_codon:yes gene_type:complete
MDCTICSDKITLENCVNTECGHTFCKDCFWKWTKENNTCPLCRHSILANSEELREQQHIRKMIEQRTEISRQIQYFQEKLTWLKNRVNNVGETLNNIEDKNNTTIVVSNHELNSRRLQLINQFIHNNPP